MGNFTETLSKFWNKITDKKMLRYYGAVVVLALLIVLLYRGTDDTTAEPDPMAGAYSNYKSTRESDELTQLIRNYYTAYASGDIAALSEIATPLSESEQSYITFFSQYVEDYENIDVKYKQGLDEASFLVSVALDMKLQGIDTLAPGLDFFYVETNEEGKLFINNLYGSYNRENAEYTTDPTIAALIKAFESQDDITKLNEEVTARYNEALSSDESLSDFVNTTFPEAAIAWATEYQQALAAAQAEAEAQAAAEAAAQAEAEAQAAAEAEAAAQAEAEAQAAAEAAAQAEAELANAEVVYPTARVNVRDGASGEAGQIGQVDSGTELRRLSEEGEWSRISFNDGAGYVKTEYLTTADASIAPGTVVTLSEGVNLRAEMNESAEKIGKAGGGEAVTVLLSYASGWSRVDYNGLQGFMKTEFLR